ncbi:MAG: transketolase family protein, partial [Deltaproteobacteria bacterium]|nr:transketolase family protein [Deltaproteobacteria bacterium]
AEIGAKYPRVVVCDADLSKSTMTQAFMKKYPERHLEVGIAEQNMIGIAAGLALSGKVPVAASFACFLIGRLETIRVSAAYNQTNMKLVGTHAGIGIGDDGHSQMGLEDISLMRELPTMMVFQPGDELETRQLIEWLASDAEAVKHPAYVRLTRQNLVAVHDASYKWQFGKLDVLKRGSKVALIGTGAGLQECVAAYEQLKAKGLEVTLANAHTLKPFDAAGTVALARDHKFIFTVEDHYVTGGLGSCVAEALAEAGTGTKLVRLGVQDMFGESGEPVELYEKFGFSGRQIAEKILKTVG